MRNSFFDQSLDAGAIRQRVQELSTGKVGFYSVGLYPASLAYNCAMQNAEGRLLLAPRPGRDLLGAFPRETIAAMDDEQGRCRRRDDQRHADRVRERAQAMAMLHADLLICRLSAPTRSLSMSLLMTSP